MGLLGILFALGLLIWLAFRGWCVLLLAPTAGLIAAAAAREPLLAHWTQTFMGGAADAGGHRPWHIDLYHVGLAGNGHSEHHPHAVLRNHADRGATRLSVRVSGAIRVPGRA